MAPVFCFLSSWVPSAQNSMVANIGTSQSSLNERRCHVSGNCDGCEPQGVTRRFSFTVLRVYGPILRHSVMSQSPAWSSSLEFELGLLLFPVVPSFFKSCMKLCVFFMLVSFATLTGGDGCRRATTDEVRITLLAVLVASVFHHLSYKLITVTWVRCGGAIPPQVSSSHIP